MGTKAEENYIAQIEELQERLSEAEQLIEAIKAGEVDAFAVKGENSSEIYTLQSGDYAYRALVENFSEGALNLTEEGLIVYSNRYFYDLLGLSYDKVVGKSVFDFIHAPSKDEFRNLFTKALGGQSKGEIKLRAGKKTVPVYISLTSLYPQLQTVGMIVTDLSEKKLYEKQLEEKNVALLKSNAELASFSYVASHDLQEPLRKIQTFANLILNKESANLSATAQDHFQRMVKASVRMRDLIMALLDYSRTNTVEPVFVPPNLNVLLRDIKQQLAERIEESNATIEVGQLPTLNVVSLQFTQLFSNLILNSLKFRRDGVNPAIKISAQLTRDKYWEIKIEDNGIGFEQSYAEKIFELFQRLHGKSEYEGTGLGLAICKKIIQNHHGHIDAEGKPGKGSTFRIYVPAH